MHLISDIDINNLNENIIKKLISEHERELKRYKKLDKYYRGNHDILGRATEDISKPNNRLIHDYPGYIVDTLQGYFMGKPVRYGSENKEMMDKIQDIFDYNDEQDENSELAKEASIKGTTYELVYFDENSNIRFNVVDPKNMILIYDNTLEQNPLMAIRHYDNKDLLTNKTMKYIEVYTDDLIIDYKLENNTIEMTDIREHYFKDVPVIEFPNNDERIGDFEKVLTLIDAYNKSNSDTLNDIEYFADAYLVLEGMEGTEDEDVKSMKRNRVLLPSEGGKAYWLVKDINDTFIENFKTRLQNDIHKFSKVPDLTDEKFGGNLSGVAIEYKLNALEQSAVTKERKFKRALQRRLELICNALRVKGFDYDYRDIKISFVRNIPQNIKEIAEMMVMLQGILSEERILSMHPEIEDPQAELEKKEKELDDKIDLDRLIPKKSIKEDKEDEEDGQGNKISPEAS